MRTRWLPLRMASAKNAPEAPAPTIAMATSDVGMIEMMTSMSGNLYPFRTQVQQT